MELEYLFEDLIWRFNEATNEEAGDYFTPVEVIRLMVDLLFNHKFDYMLANSLFRVEWKPRADVIKKGA